VLIKWVDEEKNNIRISKLIAENLVAEIIVKISQKIVGN
jgi:hypothetical protein